MTGVKPTIPLTLRPAADFSLPDHKNAAHNLSKVMGKNGVMLGFLGDIWRPITLQRILGIQRYATRLAREGWGTALILKDQARTLANFHLSSPLPIGFPLLADTDGRTHEAYIMSSNVGLMLIDRAGMVRCKWYLSEPTILPALPEIQTIIATLGDSPAYGGA